MCWHITCKCSKSFLFRFLATKFTGRTGLKTVLNRSMFRNVKHGFVAIKKEIHLVSGAAGVWINLVPRALFFLPLLHLKGKGGLGTSSQIKKEDNYDTSSCSSGLKENIVER